MFLSAIIEASQTTERHKAMRTMTPAEIHVVLSLSELYAALNRLLTEYPNDDPDANQKIGMINSLKTAMGNCFTWWGHPGIDQTVSDVCPCGTMVFDDVGPVSAWIGLMYGSPIHLKPGDHCPSCGALLNYNGTCGPAALQIEDDVTRDVEEATR